MCRGVPNNFENMRDILSASVTDAARMCPASISIEDPLRSTSRLFICDILNIYAEVT